MPGVSCLVEWQELGAERWGVEWQLAAGVVLASVTPGDGRRGGVGESQAPAVSRRPARGAGRGARPAPGWVKSGWRRPPANGGIHPTANGAASIR
jgi:hypothetical protein